MASSSTRRLRMKDWLYQMLENNNIHGICWENRSELIFKIDWKHGSRHGYTYEKDALVFKKWAEYTGKLRLSTGPDPKRWKANFRCALNSLKNIIKIDSKQYRGAEAFRRYQFIMDKNNTGNIRNRQKLKTEKEKCPETGKCGPNENVLYAAPDVQIKQEVMDDTNEREIKSEETYQCAFTNSYCYPLDQELTPPSSPEAKVLSGKDKMKPVKIEYNPCDVNMWCNHSTFNSNLKLPLSPPLTPPDQLLPDLEMCIENLSPAEVNRIGSSCLEDFDEEFTICDDAQI